jgi:hypothetical protein
MPITLILVISICVVFSTFTLIPSVVRLRSVAAKGYHTINNVAGLQALELLSYVYTCGAIIFIMAFKEQLNIYNALGLVLLAVSAVILIKSDSSKVFPLCSIETQGEFSPELRKEWTKICERSWGIDLVIDQAVSDDEVLKIAPQVSKNRSERFISFLLFRTIAFSATVGVGITVLVIVVVEALLGNLNSTRQP